MSSNREVVIHVSRKWPFVKKDTGKSYVDVQLHGLRQLTMISQIEVNNALQQKNSNPLTKDYFHHYDAIKARGLGLLTFCLYKQN